MTDVEQIEQGILDWLTIRLHQETDVTCLQECLGFMPEDMREYVEQHPEFKQQLDTVFGFWTLTEDKPFASSDSMLERFHSALPPVSMAQPESILTRIKGWFNAGNGNSFATASAFSLVFVLGFTCSQLMIRPDNDDEGMANLQQQVSQLQATVALSLLQNSSASERLSGIAYSRQGDLTNPLIMRSLLELLEKDESSAVKLEVIRTLQTSSSLDAYESDLITLAAAEPNFLVQGALVQLIGKFASSQGRQNLIQQLRTQHSEEDMDYLLQTLNSHSQI